MTTISELCLYRNAIIVDIDSIMKGILEILFLEENKTCFFSEDKNQEQLNLIYDAINNKTIIVAEKNNSNNNEVIGFIWFNITNKSFYGSYVCVIETSRDKGIATQLYDKVINYAKENNIKKIWLDIYMCNEKSINLHNKLDFQLHITLYSKAI